MVYIGIEHDPNLGVFITENGDVLRPVNQWADKNGYKYVTIKHKNYPVHRLVAESFVSGRTAEKNIVMHKDDCPSNNGKDNLEWGSYSKNNYDAYSRGLKTKNIPVRCIETGEEFYSAREAARKMFGIPKRGDHILQVIRAERAKAYGYHWEVVGR